MAGGADKNLKEEICLKNPPGRKNCPDGTRLVGTLRLLHRLTFREGKVMKSFYSFGLVFHSALLRVSVSYPVCMGVLVACFKTNAPFVALI